MIIENYKDKIEMILLEQRNIFDDPFLMLTKFSFMVSFQYKNVWLSQFREF